MNLEATLEDLEAQGFFASQPLNRPTQAPSYCRIIRIEFEDNAPTKYLSNPILGADFIGGFLFNEPSSKWLAFTHRQIHYLETLDGQILMETPADILRIVEEHLLGVPIVIGLSQNQISGKIKALQSNCLHFVSDQGRAFHIPETSICFLSVDNLSGHLKL